MSCISLTTLKYNIGLLLFKGVKGEHALIIIINELIADRFVRCVVTLNQRFPVMVPFIHIALGNQFPTDIIRELKHLFIMQLLNFKHYCLINNLIR